MKKYVLASLSVVLMVLTTVVCTSCRNNDEYEESLKYMLIYDVIDVEYDVEDGNPAIKFCDVYTEEFKKLEGITIDSDGMLICSGCDYTQFDKLVLAACETAKANCDKTMDFDKFGGSFDIEIIRYYTHEKYGPLNKPIYSQTFTGTMK